MTTAATVRLLDHEPDFASALPEEEVEVASRAATLPVLTLRTGALDPGELAAGRPLLVLDGFVAREVVLADRPAAQLLGPGDIVDGRAGIADDLPCDIRWSALGPVQAAVLNERWIEVCRRWPALGVAMHDRMADQAARALLVAAVTALPRVEQRVVALLWILAGRWGTMTPDGATVPVSLTHDALGRLTAARRSTVTLALGRLTEQGIVVRRDDGHLALRPGSDSGLGEIRTPPALDERAPRTMPSRGRFARPAGDVPAPAVSHDALLDELRRVRDSLGDEAARARRAVTASQVAAQANARVLEVSRSRREAFEAARKAHDPEQD
ncbi:Crp/Fnr family transcriptional regulator [Conexibacter sp. SYSU D00693]|uniref:Crp/Fnr family transcriptional regulator n=1 Tax=Conexibacter sp. SYSU D00693 TaxID=2812560 RepID=UPI00196AFD43|nr:Crp/Fnr family transcriptional regulator [Conexibacter sp. SYSU D00693]